MRKINPRVILFVIVVVISVSSHWYLNTNANRQHSILYLDQFDQVQQPTEEEIDNKHTQPVLPDVLLLKKAIETGRRLIPAN